jgi:hypothetical protein
VLPSRLRAIQWPPNFKVSNIDKYEPKQDPGGWLTVYMIAAWAAGWGNRGCHDSILAHCPGAGRAAMAPTPTSTLHR